MNEKYLETRLIESHKIDIYSLREVNSAGKFMLMGYSIRHSESQKFIANFTGQPTDAQIRDQLKLPNGK